ncbi:hypothetical protein BGZ46_002579, partial [Entomortierella lignicola]
MNSIASDPIELPEIRALIASYLSKRDLSRCICANRTWNALFLPYLWEQLQLNEMLIRRGFNLKSHAHLVKSISLVDIYKFDQLIADCSNLHSLEVSVVFGRWVKFEQSIRRQLDFVLTSVAQSITRLFLTSVFIDWETISKLKNLRELNIKDCSNMIGPSTSDFCYTVQPQLESLSLTQVQIPPQKEHDINNEPIFPNVKTLVLELIIITPQSSEKDILQQCPNLETLQIRAPSRELSLCTLTKDLVRLAAAGSWPKLRNLSYDGIRISDKDITEVLKSMCCEQLELSSAEFKLESFQALSDHFSTLTRVNFAYCPSVTSKMLQEILSSCPLLKKFRGVKIHARDIAKGSPWVCTALQTFIAFIDFSKSPSPRRMEIAEDASQEQQEEIARLKVAAGIEYEEFHRTIFEKISHLRYLKILLVGTERPEWMTGIAEDFFMHGLCFRLGNGFELLGSLLWLEIFGFSNTLQDMTMSEITWMHTHWSRLKQVMGTCSLDAE